MTREGLLGGSLPYRAAGTGPPVVVLPGISADNADVRGSDRQMNLRAFLPLTHHFTVHVVNRKPGLRPGSSLRDLADDYAMALADAFPRGVPVVGVSTGGSIAQLLAIDHPRSVRRLVLFASACRLSPYGRRVQQDLARLSAAGRPRRAWAATGPALAATPAGAILTTGLMWLAGKRMNAAGTADLVVTVEAEDAFDVTTELSSITAPTLVIGGVRDRFYGADLFRQTAQGIPRARLVLYPRKGHLGAVTHRAAIADIERYLAEEPQERW